MTSLRQPKLCTILVNLTQRAPAPKGPNKLPAFANEKRRFLRAKERTWIRVLIHYPNHYPKPERQNPKPEMMLFEKPDPTRYPNTLTRPDPKPEKVLPVAALLDNV